MKKSEKWMLFSVLGALVIVGLCLVCVVGAVLVPLRWWSHGGAAGAAKDYLSKSTVVQTQLGPIKEFGRFPTGSESIINGQGSAHFVITIKGQLRNGSAELDLVRKPGQTWKVTSAVLSVEGREIPLEGASASPAPPAQDHPEGSGDSGQDEQPRSI